MVLPERSFELGSRQMRASSGQHLSSKSEGKTIAIEPEVISLINLKRADINKAIQVKIYRTWIAKNFRTMIPTIFGCILLDKKGYAIQSNIDLQESKHFENLFQIVYLRTSCPIVGNAIRRMTTASTAGSSHCSGGHTPSQYVSSSATHAPQVQVSADFGGRPPPVARNQRPSGIRSGPPGEYRAFKSCDCGQRCHESLGTEAAIRSGT